jgi:hypothetical protein
MSNKDIDIKMELSVEETLQGILNKINDSLDSINSDFDDKDEDRDGPPHNLRVARVVNELSQSYAFLSKNAYSQKNNNL